MPKRVAIVRNGEECAVPVEVAITWRGAGFDHVYTEQAVADEAGVARAIRAAQKSVAVGYRIPIEQQDIVYVEVDGERPPSTWWEGLLADYPVGTNPTVITDAALA